jgi:hypothetical protein
MKNQTKEEIISNNANIRCEIEVITKEINLLEEERKNLRTGIKPPCKYCNLDGQFRCEACEEAHFVGFNNRDWYC